MLTDDFTVDKAIFSKKGRTDREVNTRIKALPYFEKIIKNSRYFSTDTDIRISDNSAKKGVVAMHHFLSSYDDYVVDIVIRDKGNKQYIYELKFSENKKNSQQSMSKKIDSPAPLNGDVENTDNIPQRKTDVKKILPKMSLQALNSEYMKAAENGDAETAQKYVNEAAARAGYTIRAYNAQKIKMSSLPRAHFSHLNNESKTRKIRLQDDEIMVSDLFILVKQLPEAISKPVGILKSNNDNTNSDVVIISSLLDTKKIL